LRNAKIVAKSREFFPAEEPREKAALVLNWHPIYYEQPVQGRRMAVETRHD
jgi:hypothetical protein